MKLNTSPETTKVSQPRNAEGSGKIPFLNWQSQTKVTFFAEEESEVVAGRVCPLEGAGFEGQAVAGVIRSAVLPVDVGVDSVAE